MSFQAYLDNIEEKTGKTPKQFIAEAKKLKITEHKDIIAWLKRDYGLGTGHAQFGVEKSIFRRAQFQSGVKRSTNLQGRKLPLPCCPESPVI